MWSKRPSPSFDESREAKARLLCACVAPSAEYFIISIAGRTNEATLVAGRVLWTETYTEAVGWSES